jgi:Flp pilus assembly pilin Flp
VGHIAVVSFRRLRRAVRVARKSESAATLVEYGLLLMLLAVICIAAVTFLGSAIKSELYDAIGAVFGGLSP